MCLIVIDYISIVEVSHVHSTGWADQGSQQLTVRFRNCFFEGIDQSRRLRITANIR